jgi:hypothetical protein
MNKYPVGDCHVGDCKRPADHTGRHGEPTKAESRTIYRRFKVPEPTEWQRRAAKIDAEMDSWLT